MKLKFVLFLIFSIYLSSQAQKNRYRFAATYFGVEGELNLQSNRFTTLNSKGNLQSEKLPSTFAPRLLIGGTHFWNHADFYLSLNLGSLRLNGSKNADISNDVLTGFRVLPFKLKQKRPKPFIGIGFNSKEYRQKGSNGESQLYTNWQWFYEGGFTYTLNSNKLIGLEMRYFPKNEYSAYYDRNNFNNVEVSPFSFSISYKILFDFSNGYSSEKSKKLFKSMKEELAQEKKLNTFSIGIGFSAFIPFEETEHASRKAFFNDEIEPEVFPELGVEYFHHKFNASARVSYRPQQQLEKSYQYEYNLRNHSIAFEAFKFVGNYHGFMPFVGPFVSQNFYHLQEKDNGTKVTDFSESKIGYGLVFGWDIRFTETDHIILRTNMRYVPDYGFQKDQLNYTSQGLEFNFIQLVYYPQRHKKFRALN